MSDPFRSLKYFPWRLLFLSAAVTMAIATVLDYLLLEALAAGGQAIPNALLPYIGLLAPPAAAYGIGALALLITARFFREIVLSANTIWALIGCVVVLYFARIFLPVPRMLLLPNTLNIVCIALGAFLSGKRYWR